MDILGGAVGGGAAGSSFGPWGTAIGAGLGVAGGIFSWMGKDAQAAAMRRQNEEELRRRTAADAQRFGQATAAAGGMGAEFESASLQAYLGSMQAEMTRQQDWQRQAGKTNADNFSTAAGVGLFTDLGGTLSSFAKQNNYWRGG